MIERYSRKEIAGIWTLENKFRIWLNIELAACEVQAELGLIPAEESFRQEKRRYLRKY